MGYIWLIALALLIFVGFKAAFTFVEIALIAIIIILAVGGALMAVSELKNGKIGSALCWAFVAYIFGRIMFMCFWKAKREPSQKGGFFFDYNNKYIIREEKQACKNLPII